MRDPGLSALHREVRQQLAVVPPESWEANELAAMVRTLKAIAAGRNKASRFVGADVIDMKAYR